MTERGDRRAMRHGPKAGHAQRARREGLETVVLYGWHPVREALANPGRRVRRLLATENGLQRLAQAGIALSVEPEIVARRPSTGC